MTRTKPVGWTGPAEADSYVSPQVMTIDGVQQIVHLSGTGLTSVSPADGKPLWQYEWKGYPIVQPSLLLLRKIHSSRQVSVCCTASASALPSRFNVAEFSHTIP